MASSKTVHPSRQNLVKRACDPCKVRKIKCSEVAPCSRCISAGIECTFNKTQGTRGPKSLRARTIKRIAETQRAVPLCGGEAGSKEEDLGQLLELLEIYATRLYPIWPIVDAEQLAESLVVDSKARHLAKAVALATVAQLKFSSPWKGTVREIELHEDEVDLCDSTRISFFLHIYYENQTAGGTKSLLYLREAITKAQLLRIDRESSYASLEQSEQQLYRRILWLLFVTERGVAMLHKLPVILKPNIMFPWYGRAEDQAHVLPAFLKLVHLFWVFDQSGIFELLRNSDADVSNMESLARGCLELLQKKLQDSAADDIEANDVQRADMFVTRQWMRAVLWRAALRFGIVAPGNNPLDVAEEFLTLVEQLPKVALESQGPTLEFKTFEIATAVIDAAASQDSRGSVGNYKDVLGGLQRILSSSRGGNKTLLSLLDTKLAAVAPDTRILPMSTSEELAVSDNWIIGSQVTEFATARSDEPDYHSIEQQTSQMSWPPLDLGHLMRSPSPMTRMLLENASSASHFGA